METPGQRSARRESLYFPAHSQRMIGPQTFRFLNATREITESADWNDPSVDKLWLYNLHYFEDLVAEQAAERGEWHRELMSRWVRENPPCSGNGWEPFPVSLRIGNWIKWSLQGNELDASGIDSLALQAEYLYRRVEWHLLGNHLFENARALVLAGLFFEGEAAGNWLAKGLRILDGQLPEQVLADGGHFERSPMYHALVLEGLLDLIQIGRQYALSPDRVMQWEVLAKRMLAWLRIMIHPDGGIAFFNDAAFDIALAPGSLFQYAGELGIRCEADLAYEGIGFLQDSGYIRVERGPMAAWIDAAPLGPDYLPGHGHADTLSFELSVHGRRLLVNSGTGVYGEGPERLRQRGTTAHNTLVVDGQDSSEVWSGFRVARRARPFGVTIQGRGDIWQVEASHDGYRRLSGDVTHMRTWRFGEGRLVVEDKLFGRYNQARARFHFHPDVELEFEGGEGLASFDEGRQVKIVIIKGTGEVKPSTYHPEFGLSLVNLCLEVELEDGCCCVEFHALSE